MSASRGSSRYSPRFPSRRSSYDLPSLGMIGLLAGIALPAVAIPLPDTSTVSSASPAMNITNTGTGHGGLFQINNAANSKYALYGITNGSGYGVFGVATGTTSRAGYFQIINAANSSYALTGNTNGSGIAMYGVTSGAGYGVYGLATGTGRAGYFQISNPGNSSTTFTSTTNGTGKAGYFLNSNAGSVANVLEAVTVGGGSAGVFQITSASNTAYVLGAITNGQGPAGSFQNTNFFNEANTLEVRTNGFGSGVYTEQGGNGDAAQFVITNGNSTKTALTGVTNGSGFAVVGRNDGSNGSAGSFSNTNPANSSSALVVSTVGGGSALLVHGGSGLAGEFTGGVKATGLIEAGGGIKSTGQVEAQGGVKFGDGTTQDTAIHFKRYTFSLAAGAYSPNLDLPDETPVQIMGICTTNGVRGLGQVSLVKFPALFLEWTGINSTPVGTNTHGFSSVQDTHIVQLSYNGDVFLVVGDQGANSNNRDSVRVKNEAGSTRDVKITMTW